MYKPLKIINLIIILLIVNAVVNPLYAVKPRSNTHKSKNQFERGTYKDISILDKGIITLAPRKQKIMSTGEPYIWSAITDKKGNIYIGTGNEGRIYKISAKGDSSIIFKADELEIFAMIIDQNDVIYAGTSPNGKVYKILPDGSKKVFFDPEDMYIWDLELDKNNNLYVATGSRANIYKITPDGNSTVVLQSEQSHIRCLKYNATTLFAGSSGNGYVYKIEQNKKPFVILDTQMQEVHDIVVADNGIVYAAAFGETEMKFPEAVQQRKDETAKSNSENQNPDEDDEEKSYGIQSFILDKVSQAVKSPTSLFRIDETGYMKELWRGSEERIQSMILNKNGDILLGTGDKGKLYNISDEGQVSLILNVEESQITAMTYSQQGSLIVGTANLASAYIIHPETVKSASFESETIDTGSQSLWGTLSWEGRGNDGSIQFYTRSGNTEFPEQTWSPWQKAVETNNILQINSPVARFIQWKCDITSGKNNPELEKVTISYLQKNLPPEITDIIIHPPGDFFEENKNNNHTDKGIAFPQNPPKAEVKKGYRSVDWLFDDPNFDGIIFDIYYQKQGSNYWKPLVRDLANSYYSWDSEQMADGEYIIKIVAKDSPGNPETMALTGEKESEKFIIDNTGPVIKNFKAENQKLSFSVLDKLNDIKYVYYSINAGDWQILYPIDNICDSKHELFEITQNSKNENEIAIKTEDAVENVSVFHYEIKN
ncbi:hypothetical protein JXQ31_10075 [candidate division KSB1 bacterium]|nr:hypothetical protein [candidate division KSB1 bacterium]